MRGMARFGWRAHVAGGPCRKDGAQLFGPEVVFRHVGEPPVRAQPPRAPNRPTGFFRHFAAQGLDGRFPGINAAAGQLEFVIRVGLIGQQDRAILWPRDHGIGAGPQDVVPTAFDGLAKSPDHVAPVASQCFVPIWAIHALIR